MAFSGGTFSRTFDCTTDRDNGVKILATKFDTELDGMATGLSTTILKDGTQTCTAAIPFAQGITLPDDKTIAFGTNSDVLIQYDETTTDSLKISAAEGAGLAITLMADEGDDAGDEWKLNIADGGTLTLGNDINSAGTYVTHLTITPNATVANSTMAVAGNLTVGGDLTLGSGAVITEAELETIDGITPGTAAALKAMVLDANLDISGGRNLTISGELDAADGDFSGDVDVDGTLEADAMTLNGTAITATATLNTGISNNNVPKFTSGAVDDDFLRIDGTAIEGRSAAEVLSDIAAAPAAGSSNIVTTGALNSGSITSGFGTINTGSSNITTTGVGSFGSLDISGDIDVDGTTNLDAVDIDGAVDMASTLQVDGAITSSAGATITTADNTSQLTLKSTDADATVGPVLTLNRDSGSPADGDNLGQIQWLGDNDAGQSLELHSKFVKLRDASDGAEDTQVFHYAFVGGSQLDFLRYGTGSAGGGAEFVINEASADIDFRVESDNSANALFVQGSDGAIGMGTGSPATATGGGIDIERGGGASVRIDDTSNSVTGELQVYSAGLNLATITNHDILFATNNTTRARINSTGVFSNHLNSDGSNIGVFSNNNVFALADEAFFTITLGPSGAAGGGLLAIYEVASGQSAIYHFGYNRSTLVSGSTSVFSTSDTDGFSCAIASGHSLFIKNRRGSSITYATCLHTAGFS